MSHDVFAGLLSFLKDLVLTFLCGSLLFSFIRPSELSRCEGRCGMSTWDVSAAASPTQGDALVRVWYGIVSSFWQGINIHVVAFDLTAVILQKWRLIV